MLVAQGRIRKSKILDIPQIIKKGKGKLLTNCASFSTIISQRKTKQTERKGQITPLESRILKVTLVTSPVNYKHPN